MKKLRRYQVLVLFILFSVLLFFGTRLIAGVIYSTEVTSNIIEQINGALVVVTKFLGLYLIILFLSAFSGLFLSKAKGKTELTAGFKLSLIYCMILLLLYVVVFFIE